MLPIQYAKILYALTKDAQKSDLESIIVEFIRYLKERHVTSKVDFIIKEFVRYSQQQEGKIFLQLSSSRTLSKEQIHDITTHFGSNVDVETHTDGQLIGGVIIRNGNTILDGSIRAQLLKLKHELG